jgi:Domain of unknown function (DUF1876)
VTYNPNGVQNSEFDYIVIQTEEVAAAEVNLRYRGRYYKGVGDAKRHPTDAHDAVYAHNLALARALSELAVNLINENADD